MKYVALFAAVLIATTGLALAKQKSQTRAAAATCPAVNILTDATRITQIQNGRIDLKAEIRDPQIACTVAGGKAKSKLDFWVKSAISPNANVANRAVPYFVAIIVDGEVIGKEIFNLNLAFTKDRKLLVKEEVDRIDIPVAEGRRAEDYSVTIGFQLTPEQAAYNRTAQR